jgi:hypothetical protein
LGDVAAGVGAPLNDIVYLYGTLQTQGRAYTKDIMQFTSRGIPIIEELANQFGKSKEEVMGMVEAGKVGFPEVERAFNAMTGEGGLFFNLMQEQSKTLAGQISNLKDAYARMLNEFGKSSENVFTASIQGLMKLVENYETVLDVLGVLVATYGTYRAAIIATNIQLAIATGLTKGYTIAETLRFQAMLLSERAMKLLNATMLSNPYVAVATAIAAVVAALIIFRKEAVQAKNSAQLTADANKKVSASFDEQRDKIRLYVDRVKQGNLTDQERVSIYKELQTISPKLVSGMDAQTLAYDKLKTNVTAYTEELRKQFKLEANKEALLESYKQEREYQKLIEQQKKRIATQAELKKVETDALTKAAQAGVVESNTDAETKKLKDLEQAEKDARKASEELAGERLSLSAAEKEVGKQQERNAGFLRKRIADLKEEQSTVSNNRDEWLMFEKQIKSLESELENITGKQAAKAVLKDIKDARKDLQELLKDVSAAEVDAAQAGIIKTEKEVDRINRKYNDLKTRIDQLSLPGTGLTQNDLLGVKLRVERARTSELMSSADKEEAEEFKKIIAEKKEIFDQFEAYKKEIGVDQAREGLAEQMGDFESYIDFLNAELKKVQFDPSLSGRIKRDELAKELTDAKKQQLRTEIENEINERARVVEATNTFAVKRKKIEETYLKDLLILQKKYSGKELIDRTKILQDQKKKELDVIVEAELEKSQVFQQFQEGFEDIGVIAMRGIIQGLELLKQKLKDNAEAVKAIDKAIKETEKAIGTRTVAAFRSVAGIVSNIAGDFSVQINKGLTITTQQIAKAFDQIGTLFDKTASKGDQIGSIIGLITFVIVGVRDALLSAEDLADPLQAQHDAYSAIANTIEGTNILLQEQKRILDDLIGAQKIQLSFDYLDKLKQKQDETLKSLQDFKIEFIKSQKEIFVDPVFGTQVSTGGINALADIFLWGGQAKRKMKFELEAVDTSGLNTIEQFVELLAEIKRGGGKLNGKTILEDDIKGLELLIKTYQEAEDQQEEFRRNLQQLLTGTTEQSLVDSIADGFKSGLRSANDFAGKFEDMMRNAVLQSLKISALEGPLRTFYEEFAKLSASDELLTEGEIQQLRERFNVIIGDAGKKFDELQRITNLNLTAGGQSTSGNNLTGAIKGITEQQAELLAGQFGGLRITALDHLSVARGSLESLQRIDLNTGVMIVRLTSVLQKFDSYETGSRALKVFM